MCDPTCKLPSAFGPSGAPAPRSAAGEMAPDTQGPGSGRAGPALQPPRTRGQVSLLITDGAVWGLRRTARLSGCRLAEMLLAMFGLALDRQGLHGEAAITVLRPEAGRGRALPRGMAGGGAQQRDEAAMPMDLYRAIAGGARPSQDPADAPGGVAFRYTRCWVGEATIERLLESDAPDERGADGGFDLLLAVSEFDDELLLECFYRTAATTEPSARQLLQAYAGDLADIAESSPGTAGALRA